MLPPEREKIRELIARRSLRLAFHINPSLALEELEEAEKVGLISVDASTLTSDLQAEAIVRIYLAKALQLIAVEPYLKSRATEIEESEKSNVDESLMFCVFISESEYELISELVTGDQQSLWEAFVRNPPLALNLIVKHAKAGYRQEAETKLTSLLKKQASVQLFMALKLVRNADETHQKTTGVRILLDEAAQLPDRETVCPALRSLKSVEPRAVIPSLIAFLRKADDKPVLDAGLETLEHLFHGGFAAHAPEPPAAPSSERSTDFVEPPRVPIHLPLTIIPGSEETSPVARMDATQEVSPTVAPPLDLDLSTHQFTTNGGGHDFSPGRSAAATAVRHADPLDLATMSFTTTDRAVQHTRMLVSGPSARIAPAMAERERFREGYRALGTLVESGQINAAVLNGPMAAFNKAYRELDGAESQRVIGVSKAAKILGLTKSRVQQLAREGLGQKVAGRFLFTREELEREKQRPRSRSGRPPTADQLDLASMFFTTADPAVQHTRMLLVSGLGENIGLARAEQERFRDRYRALGTLMESGEINTAALEGLMAALNEAYRELLDGEGGASGQGKFPPPRNLERDPGWVDRSFEREAFPTTGTGTERVLGVSEAAGILGLTRSRVQQLARDGLIGQRVAGRFLFTRQELDREKQRPRSKGGRPPTRRNEDSGRPETRPS